MAKATVLQLLLPSTGGTFDATKTTQTGGIKDSTTGLPSAGSFNNQDAGWAGAAGVSNVLVRRARNVETVFALNSGVPALNDGTTARGGWNTTTGLGNPDTVSFVGTVSGDEISDIKGLPA